jgi:hypothetical protein
VSPGRRPRLFRGAVLIAVLPSLFSLLGCTRAVNGVAMPGQGVDRPASAEELGKLVVTDVPSGMAQTPDDELDPPAGPKGVEDIAGYSDDPDHERAVLERYGYLFGWERFWGDGSWPMTSVFVDQFETWAGAASYSDDLASNDAEYYDGVVRDDPPDMPDGCRTLTVDAADPEAGLEGPSVFAWCRRGVFSVFVTAGADSVDAAAKEVRGVLEHQLDRLPAG